MKIIVDSACNIQYSSFYIYGLNQKYGTSSITFASKPFHLLPQREACFNFIVINDEKEIKITIDYGDFNTLIEAHYQWSDVYGKVNYNRTQTGKEYTKIISLAPSFGIQLWPFGGTLRHCVLNYLKNRFTTPQAVVSIRKFIGKYKRQYLLRSPISAYEESVYLSNDKYIFSLSSLWQSDDINENDEGVNKYRAEFIRICKTFTEITFEGGLTPSAYTSEKQRIVFQDVMYSKWMNFDEYLEKTKQSILVFNTPAYWQCHGWKLGEYLALGKAIISMPLVNDLPIPLEHGKNIHFISSEAEIESAIRFLLDNVDYRRRLETGAKEYWNKYGTPLQSISMLGL
ncbi:MAG: hypothetical protein P4L28_00605 [Paludibacteraceae bacterium]|nr:hypothetical protein [Paludibacteraceae bacterium]